MKISRRGIIKLSLLHYIIEYMIWTSYITTGQTYYRIQPSYGTANFDPNERNLRMPSYMWSPPVPVPMSRMPFAPTLPVTQQLQQSLLSQAMEPLGVQINYDQEKSQINPYNNMQFLQQVPQNYMFSSPSFLSSLVNLSPYIRPTGNQHRYPTKYRIHYRLQPKLNDLQGSFQPSMQQMSQFANRGQPAFSSYFVMPYSDQRHYNSNVRTRKETNRRRKKTTKRRNRHKHCHHSLEFDLGSGAGDESSDASGSTSRSEEMDNEIIIHKKKETHKNSDKKYKRDGNNRKSVKGKKNMSITISFPSDTDFETKNQSIKVNSTKTNTIPIKPFIINSTDNISMISTEDGTSSNVYMWPVPARKRKGKKPHSKNVAKSKKIGKKHKKKKKIMKT